MVISPIIDGDEPTTEIADTAPETVVDFAQEKDATNGKRKGGKAKAEKPASEPKPNKAKADKPAKEPRENKTDTLVLMLLDDKGATTDQVAKAFGWLAHTARAAISTLPKKKQFPEGHVLSKEKVEERGLVYRIVKA